MAQTEHSSEGISETHSETQARPALAQSIQHCIAHLQTQTPAPAVSDLVADLLALEKATRRNKQKFDYAQLVGTWRLGFITGTVRTRQRAGVALGAGRFIPRLVNIQIRYEADPHEALQGSVYNSVSLANLTFQLQGPTQYWPKTSSLAFDFIYLCLSVGRFQLYQQAVRGGSARTEEFFTEPLKTQAFFTYFLVTPTCLAARGRGGGLALWTRQHS